MIISHNALEGLIEGGYEPPNKGREGVKIIRHPAMAALKGLEPKCKVFEYYIVLLMIIIFTPRAPPFIPQYDRL